MSIERILLYVGAALKLWPSFKLLLDQFLQTPEAKQEALAQEIHTAVEFAAETGDTSKIAEIIRRGKL